MPYSPSAPVILAFGDLLRRLARDHAEDVEVVDRGGRGRAEEIVRHAVRVAVIENRTAFDDRSGRSDRDHLTRCGSTLTTFSARLRRAIENSFL